MRARLLAIAALLLGVACAAASADDETGYVPPPYPYSWPQDPPKPRPELRERHVTLHLIGASLQDMLEFFERIGIPLAADDDVVAWLETHPAEVSLKQQNISALWALDILCEHLGNFDLRWDERKTYICMPERCPWPIDYVPRDPEAWDRWWATAGVPTKFEQEPFERDERLRKRLDETRITIDTGVRSLGDANAPASRRV